MDFMLTILVGVWLAGWGSLWYKLGRVEAKILNHLDQHQEAHRDQREGDPPAAGA